MPVTVVSGAGCLDQARATIGSGAQKNTSERPAHLATGSAKLRRCPAHCANSGTDDVAPRV